MNRLSERFHGRGQRIGGRVRLDIGAQSGQRNTDEIDQIVGGEGHGQGKCAHQDDKLEDADPGQAEQELEEKGGNQERSKKNQAGVRFDPTQGLRGDEGGALGALDEDEVGDGGEPRTAPDRAVAPEPFLVVEGEDDAADELNNGADDERHHHRQQDPEDDGQRLAGVDVLHHPGEAVAGLIELEQRHCHRSAEELEDDGDRGRGGQAEGVVEIEQQNIGEHDREEDGHQFGHGEELRVENALARDLHHPR